MGYIPGKTIKIDDEAAKAEREYDNGFHNGEITFHEDPIMYSTWFEGVT